MKKQENLYEVIKQIDDYVDDSENFINYSLMFMVNHLNIEYLEIKQLSFTVLDAVGIQSVQLTNGVYRISKIVNKEIRNLRPEDYIISVKGISPHEFNDPFNVTDIEIHALRINEDGIPAVIQEKQKLKLVQSKILRCESNEAFYFKLDRFDQGIVDELAQVIRRHAFTELILDLRNNLGGKIKHVNEVLSNFVNGKMNCYTMIDKNKKIQEIQISGILNKEFNLYILINEITCSSAELLALVCKQKFHANIIGTQSYGKSTICKKIKINDSLYLTLPKYTFEVDNNDINKVGIIPDYTIDDNELDYIINTLRPEEKFYEKTMAVRK